MTDAVPPTYDANRQNPNQELNLSEAEILEILGKLRRKEGNWIAWGKLCHQLHRAQLDPKDIFDETGFEAIIQNQTIVAAQVFDSAQQVGISPQAEAYCNGPRSDVLYELRVLKQQERAQAVEFAAMKNLDIDGAHLLARAMKEVAWISTLPPGFTRHPGDAVAYQCWKQARQKKDLQERSRLIAQGFKFVHTDAARQQLEALLSDFSVVAMRKAPMLPFFRVDQEEELPRIIPFMGDAPLSVTTFAQTPSFAAIEPFRIVNFAQAGVAGVPIPGWASIVGAKDPVCFLEAIENLPNTIDMQPERVLVVIDRANREWAVNSYFAIQGAEVDGVPTIELRWFEAAPEVEILGKLILLLRPKWILDESNITEPWQMDD